MRSDKKFWRKKKVLVTGFEGFLGSNLVRVLLNQGAKVIGIDIKTFRDETILSPGEYSKMVVYKGSVTNRSLVRRILRKHRVKVIFHLAAEAIVGRSQANPLRAFNSNIAGTWEVLEAARQQGKIESIVVASSDKAYGSHKKLPYREDTALIAKHPYDVSKSCADLITHAYFYSYGLPVVITRCGNIYGPGDFNFSRIVPDAIRCALTGKRLLIRSDGKFTRDYVYIDDIVYGYIGLAENLQRLNLSGEAFNFSDENPIEVIKIVEKIYGILRKKANYKILNQAKCEIRHQYLASGKARRILKWKPGKNLEDGLRDTVKWYAKLFS